MISATIVSEDPVDRARLSKLFGMLGSSFPGERSAALEKIDAELRHTGLTWSWLKLLVERGELPGAGDREPIFKRLVVERLSEGLHASWAMGDGEASLVRKVLVDCESGVSGLDPQDLRRAIEIADTAIRRGGQRSLLGSRGRR